MPSGPGGYSLGLVISSTVDFRFDFGLPVFISFLADWDFNYCVTDKKDSSFGRTTAQTSRCWWKWRSTVVSGSFGILWGYFALHHFC